MSLVFAWTSQFHIIQRAPGISYSNVNPVINVAAGIVVLCFLRRRPIWSVVLLVYVFDQLVEAFAFLYWSYGGAHNFTSPLSHLDSLYFALGTLSTAGTGNIAAVSDSAKRIQAVQMGLDIALLLFAVAIVVAGITNRIAERQRLRAAAQPVLPAQEVDDPYLTISWGRVKASFYRKR